MYDNNENNNEINLEQNVPQESQPLQAEPQAVQNEEPQTVQNEESQAVQNEEPQAVEEAKPQEPQYSAPQQQMPPPPPPLDALLCNILTYTVHGCDLTFKLLNTMLGCSDISTIS